MENNNRHLMQTNNLSANSKGGTELMQERLYASLPTELLERFQIWFSRYRPDQVDWSKHQIFYAHDLPGDPESDFLANGGWQKFHRLVFVSNWQMQQYCQRYGIPMSKCLVMLNAIEPIEVINKPTDGPLRIGYWSTPHRGLNIAVAVFEHLANQHDNIVFDVFSSFKLYGWDKRDEEYAELLEKCRNHPKINYHGTVDNTEIRRYAADAHILAYPSTWPETSCIVLMEAMSAKMLCVHSNLAALYETAANWTAMYQYQEDQHQHAQLFHQHMEAAIQTYGNPLIQQRLDSQKAYADVFYNWNIRKQQWEIELRKILTEPALNQVPPEMFSYTR